MHKEYLQYTKNYFLQYGGYYHPDCRYNFRSKYEHTVRVLRWCNILKEDISDIDTDVLFTAAIFHDLGYSQCAGKDSHAEKSSDIFEEYAKEQHLDSEFAKKVSYLIKMHSNKELLGTAGIKPELIVLMEADLLDEEGALRIIWYCATKAIEQADRYEDFLDFIQMGSDKRLINPMVTPLARELWDKKVNLVNNFMKELSSDIDMELPFL